MTNNSSTQRAAQARFQQEMVVGKHAYQTTFNHTGDTKKAVIAEQQARASFRANPPSAVVQKLQMTQREQLVASGQIKPAGKLLSLRDRLIISGQIKPLTSAARPVQQCKVVAHEVVAGDRYVKITDTRRMFVRNPKSRSGTVTAELAPFANFSRYPARKIAIAA